MCKEEKKIIIDRALNPFGFKYDEYSDIITSINNGWQRDMGYTDLYDLNSSLLNMVFDAEPIFFKYGGKEYRLEFWKGQYGIATGAEIGLYEREPHKGKDAYRAAYNDERLDLGFELYKNCLLFGMEDKSWWLTGFKPGLFSRPKDLTLKVGICFPNSEMQMAFLKGMFASGYTKNKISVYGDFVSFCICEPNNYRLNAFYRIWKFIVQIFNRINCAFYMFITRFFRTTLDKLIYLSLMFPLLYRLIIKISIPRKRRKKRLK